MWGLSRLKIKDTESEINFLTFIFSHKYFVMKKALLILLISLLSFQGFAQDPDLFRTWYLHFFQETDLGYPFEISEITPLISPYLVISEDLSFNGEGACNTYEGNFNHIGTNYLETSSFIATNTDCGVQIHNNFEDDFFGYFSEFEYQITEESNGLTLGLYTPLFGQAIFRDYPLSTSDNVLSEFKIYPNPTSEKLFISSENNHIQSISIFSVSGKKVKEITASPISSIDVSNLSKGIYFIKIFSSEGNVVKKFMKN